MKGRDMNEVFLSKGAHKTRDEGMCAMEFASYLAGLEHTDRPACVSPVLLKFMTKLNDSLGDNERQQLRPYIVRTLGTARDGQDQARALLAADWAVRVCAPMALEAIGRQEQAISLRTLAPVVDVDSARAAARVATDAAAIAAVAGEATDAADAALAAVAADAALAAVAAALAACATDAAAYAADAAAYAADVWKSGLGLLERMVDPGRLHDVKTEAEWRGSAGVAG